MILNVASLYIAHNSVNVLTAEITNLWLAYLIGFSTLLTPHSEICQIL